MNRRQALRLLAALGATGLTASCAGEGNPTAPATPTTGVPISVGLLMPQAGGLKAIGDDVLRGFQLYLDLHDGQLGGHPVRLETANEGDTAESGVAGLKDLLARGVIAVSGVATSTVMLAVRDTIRQAKVPLVGSNASPVSLQGEVYIWRTSYVDSDAARAMGPHLAESVDGRVLIVATSPTDGRDVVEGFREGFGARDPRLIPEPVWAGDQLNPRAGAFRDAVARIRAAAPAAVFCSFAGAAAIEFVRQYREAGLTPRLYAAGFLTEGEALTELGEDAAGIVTSMNYSADLPNSANRLFTAAYRQAHTSSPTTYAMASYDAAQVLDKAIQLAGANPSAQQVNLMLGKVGQIDSPRGVWQFNQSRTPQQTWYLREVRRDGQVLSNVLIRQLNTLG
jgi:branched-chain amino acid transport system substrate-binding protein